MVCALAWQQEAARRKAGGGCVLQLHGGGGGARAIRHSLNCRRSIIAFCSFTTCGRGHEQQQKQRRRHHLLQSMQLGYQPLCLGVRSEGEGMRAEREERGEGCRASSSSSATCCFTSLAFCLRSLRQEREKRLGDAGCAQAAALTSASILLRIPSAFSYVPVLQRKFNGAGRQNAGDYLRHCVNGHADAVAEATHALEERAALGA